MRCKKLNPATITAVAGLITLAGVMATSANAGRHDRSIAGYVTAHSEFGNGSVSGPVRRTRLGPQVRLPGGAWVYCARSCADTLRLKTVDFFQSEEGAGGRAALTEERGLLHNWLHWERNF